MFSLKEYKKAKEKAFKDNETRKYLLNINEDKTKKNTTTKKVKIIRKRIDDM